MNFITQNLFAIFLVFILHINTANSILIFDNGEINGASSYCDQKNVDVWKCGGNDGSGWTIYDDFIINDTSIITGFSYNDYFITGNISNYLLTRWSIWDGNPTLGGSVILNGNTVASAVVGDLGSYMFSVTSISIQIDTGTYYLGVSNLVSGSTMMTPAIASGKEVEPGFITPNGAIQVRNSFPTQMVNITEDRAFKIFGTTNNQVPEPQVFNLFIVGFIILFLYRKSKNLLIRTDQSQRLI